MGDQFELPGLPDPKEKKKRQTWVTPFEELLKRHIGCRPNRGRLMRELRYIRDYHDHDYATIFERFQLFICYTKPKYASPTYFRTSYARWTAEGYARWQRERELDAEQRVRQQENLAAVRGPSTDPVPIAALIEDIERRGRVVPQWLRKAVGSGGSAS